MSYSKISIKLTKFITKDLEFDEERQEIIVYSIETLLLSLIGFALILLVSSLFNALIPSAIAAIFGGILRRFSGGAHFNTPFKCLAFGTLVYSSIGIITNNLIKYQLLNNSFLIIFLIVSLLFVCLFAPVDSIAKPINSKKLRLKLKIASVCFVLITFLFIYFEINFLFKTSAILGIMYQSITLLPIFNKEEVTI